MSKIVKAIDSFGRIIIPIELLRTANLDRGDYIELSGTQTSEGQPALLVTKYHHKCLFCGEVLLVGEFKKLGKNEVSVCYSCINDIDNR